jgi:pimeloyl-ACP methyl ester carboxylesterase
LRAFLDHSERPSQVAVPAKDLANVKVKTLIIWGEHDGFLPPKNGEDLAKALPDASLHLIKRCGHIPHEEQHGETNKVIRAFL